MKKTPLKILALTAVIALASCGGSTSSEASSETVETPEAPVEAEVAESEETNSADVTSTLVWSGAKVIGDSHTGTIALQDVQLDLEDGNLKGGSFTIDMNSIVNTDVESEEWNQKLVNHLKSEDFFETQTYPTSTFAITSVEEQADGKLSVTGDLTVKATTKSETFEVVKNETDAGYSFTASIEIDRTDYDVKYGSTNFFDNLGDKAIKNEIKLDVNLIAAR